MQISFPYILTSLIALASIIAPVIVTLLNNKYSFRMKEKEAETQIYQEQKIQINKLFQNYLSALGKATINPTSENIKYYCEIYFTTLIHVPLEHIHGYSEIYDFVTNVNIPAHYSEKDRVLSIKNCLEQSVLPIIKETTEKS
ncbi:hypothetical protein HB948_00405 [Listeria welshimeri]|nr:hypothetical protein [Listeria welshimeri]MBC2014069.1 hypothetical protein [Listeria welshimeri]